MKKLRWVLIYLFTAKLCLRSLFRLNLGDEIVYKNEVWILINGPSSPLWTIHRKSDNKRLEYIHQDEFKKIKSLKNWIHDMKSTWRFYSGYWFDIWYAKNGSEISKMRSWL